MVTGSGVCLTRDVHYRCRSDDVGAWGPAGDP